MTSEEYIEFLQQNAQKALRSIRLVQSSLHTLEPYTADHDYSDKELEPYDALSDHFMRAIETCLKCFRTYELYLYAENSSSLRDMLLRMEKHKIITSVDRWFEMRDLRNRLIHDYLPEQLVGMYILIGGTFAEELVYVAEKLRALNQENISSKNLLP
jgi:hypothetical protein